MVYGQESEGGKQLMASRHKGERSSFRSVLVLGIVSHGLSLQGTLFGSWSTLSNESTKVVALRTFRQLSRDGLC
jgi:hypothetical protein